MSINSGSKITYQDLVNLVLNTIKSKCQNIDSISSNVPSQLRNGYSRTIDGGTIQCQWGDRPSWATLSTVLRLNDSYLNVVSSSTVANQFNSFMISRGIATRSNTMMTLRGILNFMANAAAFIRAHMMVVSGNDTSTKILYYNQNNTSYPAVSSDGIDSSTLSDSFLTTNLNNMLDALNHADRFHSVVYNVSVNCSSSCSSSSSSSSSSSCSSSSYFIGYMKL